MKKKWLALLLAMVLMVSSIAACGGGEDAEEPVDESEDVVDVDDEDEDDSEEDSDLKVGMVTDEGGVNDQSFNQSAWEGLQKVEDDMGIETRYQESEQDSDFEPNFETLLDNDFDMLWGVGFKLADATYESALANPDKSYGIIDFSYEGNDDFDGTPENVIGVMFRDEQSSFLAGYVAGHTTETDKVGFVGGIEGDVISKFEFGYTAGVKYAANELDKEIEVLSQYADSFGDAGKGKSMATNMFQQGADVVFHAAGGVGDGVIEAAKEQDKWAIGVDRDQHELAPEHVLTSAMKRVDVAIYNVVEDFKNGEFEGGKTVTYGLEDAGAVGLSPSSEINVDAEVLEKAGEIEEQIISGDIVPPLNEEEYEDWLGSL